MDKVLVSSKERLTTVYYDKDLDELVFDHELEKVFGKMKNAIIRYDYESIGFEKRLKELRDDDLRLHSEKRKLYEKITGRTDQDYARDDEWMTLNIKYGEHVQEYEEFSKHRKKYTSSLTFYVYLTENPLRCYNIVMDSFKMKNLINELSPARVAILNQ